MNPAVSGSTPSSSRPDVLDETSEPYGSSSIHKWIIKVVIIIIIATWCVEQSVPRRPPVVDCCHRHMQHFLFIAVFEPSASICARFKGKTLLYLLHFKMPFLFIKCSRRHGYEEVYR